jgi:hypothetical protein
MRQQCLRFFAPRWIWVMGTHFSLSSTRLRPLCS